MIEQEKEYKRVMDLIMRKDKWFNHYEIVEHDAGTIVYLKVSYELGNEIYILLGGVLKLEIGDIIRTWGREYILEKNINKVRRGECGVIGVLYRL
jgi:hypothetical protein